MKGRILWLGGLAAAMVAAGGLIGHWALAGPKVQIGGPCQEATRPSLAEIDHTPFDRLLQKYVDARGLVAYGQWKANDLPALDQYLARLSCVDLGKPAGKQAKIAFWINAYNALTIKGILREYPTSSIRNHTAKAFGYNIWKDLLLWVDSANYSLDDIEHKILRKMGEPRIHFAIVCASIGCPPLANRAYTPANLEYELAANARRFFANPNNFRADPSNRTIHVSQLLKWYGTDFAATPAQQARILRPYFPAADSLRWINEGVSVTYLPYDWSLNDQRSTSR